MLFLQLPGSPIVTIFSNCYTCLRYRKALNTKLFSPDISSSSLQSSSPRYLRNLITLQPSRSSTRSSTPVFQPSVRSSHKITNRSFRHGAPHLWNTFPPSLRVPYQSGASSSPSSSASSGSDPGLVGDISYGIMRFLSSQSFPPEICGIRFVCYLLSGEGIIWRHHLQPFDICAEKMLRIFSLFGFIFALKYIWSNIRTHIFLTFIRPISLEVNSLWLQIVWPGVWYQLQLVVYLCRSKHGHLSATGLALAHVALHGAKVNSLLFRVKYYLTADALLYASPESYFLTRTLTLTCLCPNMLSFVSNLILQQAFSYGCVGDSSPKTRVLPPRPVPRTCDPQHCISRSVT